jgi:hypothetical protein
LDEAFFGDDTERFDSRGVSKLGGAGNTYGHTEATGDLQEFAARHFHALSNLMFHDLGVSGRIRLPGGTVKSEKRQRPGGQTGGGSDFHAIPIDPDSQYSYSKFSG